MTKHYQHINTRQLQTEQVQSLISRLHPTQDVPGQRDAAYCQGWVWITVPVDLLSDKPCATRQIALEMEAAA